VVSGYHGTGLPSWQPICAIKQTGGFDECAELDETADSGWRLALLEWMDGD
jgi:hypothetical protein